MNDWIWVFLLLPVAAASGWYAGRRSGDRQRGQQVSRLSTTYFRGLNFLLNEQPDKAIEVFLEIAEVDKGTVETHFALGHLFRRRGEVDRAIRVHQNLVDRASLTDEQRTQAVLELGEDFMRAGLLDRAEQLFSELVKLDVAAPKALAHLISIYQQERDWPKAIEHARRFETATGEPKGKLVAQFQCEQAEQARAVGDMAAARSFLAAAYRDDSNCIRAGIVEGQIELAAGNDQAAIRAFERVARNDVEYLPEFLKPLLSAYERRGERSRARAFLAEMIERYPGVSALLAQTRLIEQDESRDAAVEFLTRQLRQRPTVRGQGALIDLNLAQGRAEERDSLLVLKQLTEQLVAGTPSYRCGRCGFGARAHHWQCPSCKSWSTVKPIHGPTGE
ncbi:MAG: lipopolysaccharide assembly protein LapB [Chiayiivirga sp.]|uniref:lipopolysaccharide assembly protein LapB n=1 Tax=Chiayiivirga sp. TaxID=2041042 RepID=UPI0025BC4953|nr:lipopolysaccharide assembly protein LapB [Chiayiivirga sp.]MCI1709778.1 lipopolysaccharide assembly protein LapB [Chiayiivirga sp.]MCI1729916.1 lipopolysaccharide assembly protein LapB [Chiayiivirga sp.]